MKEGDEIIFWNARWHSSGRPCMTRENGRIRVHVPGRKKPGRTPEQMKEILRVARERRPEREARGE